MDKYEFDFYIKEIERYIDNSAETILKSSIEGNIIPIKNIHAQQQVFFT